MYINTYYLKPKNQKSFYKKARVIDTDRLQFLKSYETIVAVRDKIDGVVYRTWSGYSASTQKHIKDFCGLNKKEYTNMAVFNYKQLMNDYFKGVKALDLIDLDYACYLA